MEIKRLDKETLNTLIDKAIDRNMDLDIESYYIPNEDDKMINTLADCINEKNLKVKFHDNKIEKRIKDNIRYLVYIKHKMKVNEYFNWFNTILRKSTYFIKDDERFIPLTLKQINKNKIIAYQYEVDKSLKITDVSEVTISQEHIYEDNYRFPVSKKEFLIMEQIGGQIND